jgi:hypothetical protein
LTRQVPIDDEGESMADVDYPTVRQVVLDTTVARRLAEFYRELVGYRYRPGDEPPPAGEPDENGQDWLVLRDPDGSPAMAFQQVRELPRATWPEGPHPQQLHLDMTVPTVEAFAQQDRRVLELGGEMIYDRSDDEEEPLRVYADPAGHPFCIFVSAG